jgi:hypothetical protein
MMMRARKVKDGLLKYIQRHPEDKIPMLTQEEWRHLDYLIKLLHPFAVFTEAMSRIEKGPTVHLVFALYNALFEHLEENEKKFTRKRVLWKRTMLDAVRAGYKKLKRYYAKTTKNVGSIYATATILSPKHKLDYFDTTEWRDDSTDWVS